MKPIIRVTIQGGVVCGAEYFPGSKTQTVKETPIVQIWDFDCEGDGGNFKNSEGEEFNFSAYTPEIISGKDLICTEII